MNRCFIHVMLGFELHTMLVLTGNSMRSWLQFMEFIAGVMIMIGIWLVSMNSITVALYPDSTMSFHVEYQMGMFGVKAPRDNRLKFISGYDAVQLMDAMRDSKIMFHALIRCDSIECMDSRKTFKPITSDMLRELFENNATHHVMTETCRACPRL